MKQAFGIFTSLVTAGLIIIMAQMIREGLFPAPQGIDFSDKQAVSAWMTSLPSEFYITIAISHGLGSFAAGLISSLVSGTSRMTVGMVSFCIVFTLVISYLFKYYFPVWFVLTDTVVTFLLGFLGVIIGSARHVS